MEQFENAPVPRAESTNRLKVGAVGLFGVLFMALANAAPITASDPGATQHQSRKLVSSSANACSVGM